MIDEVVLEMVEMMAEADPNFYVWAAGTPSQAKGKFYAR